MRLVAALLAVALAGPVHAIPAGWLKRSAVLARLPFSTPGCHPSGSFGLTMSRGSVATYVDGGGTLQTCAANQLRVGPDGAIIESAATNYALNATTHPKTAEETASLATGAYVAWHAGAGTLTVAAGTAVVTGLSCSAVAAGTLCPFTVTTAGTMSITTTSGTTRVQVEGGAVASSFIATAGASATRAADRPSMPMPAGFNPAQWCVGATVRPNGAWSARNYYVAAAGPSNSTNSLRLSTNTANRIVVDTYDGAAAIFTVNPSHGFTGSASHRIFGCFAGSTAGQKGYADGSVLSSGTSGTGTGLAARPATFYPGNASTSGAELNGALSDLVICRRGTPGLACK